MQSIAATIVIDDEKYKVIQPLIIQH